MTPPRPMQIAQVALRGDLIDLGVGQPGQALLPIDIIRQAADHRLARDGAAYLQYGAEQGDGWFRDALAAFIDRTHGHAPDPDHLFVTGGASQALDLICTLFVPPGSVVCVEDPSYHLALNSLRDHRLRLEGLPTDADGLVTDGLDERLARLKPALLYLIPTFQNPTGATLPDARRERLVELARRHDVIVVADEVYHPLGTDLVPPPSFGRFVTGAPVLALGSFSKILAPGLRLGWIQGDAARVRRLVDSGLLDSGGGLNPFASGLVRSVLELGLLEPWIARLTAEFRTRIGAMTEALARYCPGVRFDPPRGGYFIWGRLPDGLDATTLRAAANARGVDFRPGALFSIGAGMGDRFRLSFAAYDAATLVEGIRRLGAAITEVG